MSMLYHTPTNSFYVEGVVFRGCLHAHFFTWDPPPALPPSCRCVFEFHPSNLCMYSLCLPLRSMRRFDPKILVLNTIDITNFFITPLKKLRFARPAGDAPRLPLQPLVFKEASSSRICDIHPVPIHLQHPSCPSGLPTLCTLRHLPFLHLLYTQFVTASALFCRIFLYSSLLLLHLWLGHATAQPLKCLFFPVFWLQFRRGNEIRQQMYVTTEANGASRKRADACAANTADVDLRKKNLGLQMQKPHTSFCYNKTNDCSECRFRNWVRFREARPQQNRNNWGVVFPIGGCGDIRSAGGDVGGSDRFQRLQKKNVMTLMRLYPPSPAGGELWDVQVGVSPQKLAFNAVLFGCLRHGGHLVWMWGSQTLVRLHSKCARFELKKKQSAGNQDQNANAAAQKSRKRCVFHCLFFIFGEGFACRVAFLFGGLRFAVCLRIRRSFSLQ